MRMRGGTCQSRAAKKRSAEFETFASNRRNAFGIGQCGDLARQTAGMLASDRHGEHLLGKPLEGAQKSRRILARKRTADECQRPWRLVLEIGERLGEHARTVFVVRAVEPDFRAFRRERRHWAFIQVLQPRRPFGAQKPGFDGRGRKIGLDHPQRSDRIGRILMLMAAREPRQRQIEQALLILEDEAPMLFPRAEILACDRERRRLFARFPRQHLERLLGLQAEDGRHLRLEDSRLFESDLGQCRAQKFGMIIGDGRDDRRGGTRDDIGRIDPAAETNLQEQIIGLMLAEEL